jgi:hypothetical protein
VHSEFCTAVVFGEVTADKSIIGVSGGIGLIDNGGNLVGTNDAPIDPLLGPLTDNGGPTMTHELLAGSPAIDAGDPAAVAGVDGVPEFDQRGATYLRVSGGRIDMGAFEVQPIVLPALLGDYNLDGNVDAADYTVWGNTFGNVVAPFAGADGSGNGSVDEDDYGVWKASFGHTLPSDGGGSLTVAESSLSSRVVHDVQTDSSAPSISAQSEDLSNFAPLTAIGIFSNDPDVPRYAGNPRKQPLPERDNFSIRYSLLAAWLDSRMESDRSNGEAYAAVELPASTGSSDPGPEALDSVFELLGVE